MEEPEQPPRAAAPAGTEAQALCRMIAEQLGETEPGPILQIKRVVRILGQDQAQEILTDTLATEEQGGMLLADQSRRRSPGGVFFALVRRRITSEERRAIFPFKTPPKKATPSEAGAGTSGTSQQPVQASFTWDDRLPVLSEVLTEKGTVTVKVTLIGRPGRIVERDQCMVTSMLSTKVPALPKGLPVPPSVATTYTVYISTKQWRTVADAITDPEDILIVEGFQTIDQETKTIAVFASHVTTKKGQAALRQGRAAQGEASHQD